MPTFSRDFRPDAAPADEVIGLPRDLLDTPIVDHRHAVLAAEAGVQDLVMTDDMPVPAPSLREGYYGERHHEWWLSGLLDARKVEAALGQRESVRHLDFGGCSGRVARHLARLPGWECWLCDIQDRYVDWLETHATRPIRAVTTSTQPHLPWADGTFDVITAFSVFTHIDTFEIAWLLELRRVLKPGGLLYLTVHDEVIWEALKTNDWLRGQFAGTMFGPFLDAALAAPQRDRLVMVDADAPAFTLNVFFTRDYVRRRWGRFFRSVEFLSGGHYPQSVVLLRP